MKLKIFAMLSLIALVSVSGYAMSQNVNINSLLSDNQKLENKIKEADQTLSSEQKIFEGALKKQQDSSSLEIKSLKSKIKELENEPYQKSEHIALDDENSEEPTLTAESLMQNYPAWDIDSGQTLADYNNERQAEVNKRLSENNLPDDNEFINRNPIEINREIEKQIRKNAGHWDYVPMEANVVSYGVILIE